MDNHSVILCILDGWGVAPPGSGNAISQANPQTFNYLLENYPHTELLASGAAVGLPEGQDGNSETGHLNIGAGRIVFQDLSLINMAIADGSFFTNKALLETIKHLNTFQSRLHLIGMIGNSGVHAYNEHLYALLLFAKKQNIQNVFLHLITDGRDSPPQNGAEQIKLVQTQIDKIGVGKISSIIGRYYAMDRDQRLDRTQKAFDVLVGQSGKSENTADNYLENCYRNNVFDEFVEPTAIGDDVPNTRIKAGDAVVFFNFRTDRPRQLTQMFLGSGIPNLRFVTMTKYREDFQNPVMFTTTKLNNTLGEVISKNNFNQLRAAETEKIAMVSYYFNGQNEIEFPGESHLFVDSPKVSTYDLSPRMSTDKLINDFCQKVTGEKYHLSVINIACPDMVAHTGKIDKTIEAIKASDDALAQLVSLSKETNSYLLVTADHGNAEELISSRTNGVNTQHSTSPVPLIVFHPTDFHFQLQPGKLGDIAPTILNLLQIPLPSEMNGKDLIVRDKPL
ncbi:MAG TPA: 2,3-bisphosphoglycerate-independent phosphoglycerate mutase [Candidatus Woesebacteria bacterium]|nr:2,3-bisphosphoglycerate-independent phosphoglycerate mutase [Candidatus Woesebacteria bacterium]